MRTATDGGVSGYSQKPHFAKNGTFPMLITPSARYVQERTGDNEFLKLARAMYQQTIAEAW